MKTALLSLPVAWLLLAACAAAPPPQPAVAPTSTAVQVAAAPSERPAPPAAVPTQAPTAVPTAAPTPAAGLPAASRPGAGPPTQAAAALPVGPARPTPAMTVPQDLPAAQLPQWLAWRSGPHADTYGLDKGPNTFCARCHAPANYDVLSRVDPPPNCVSCKFPTDTQVRMAEHNKFIPQANWHSIGCDVCHQLAASGGVMPGIAWRDPVAGQYQPVAGAGDLCNECHTDTETLRHQRDLGRSAHQGFTCVSCHDAHSMTASCTAANCHPAVAVRNAAAPGHDAGHAKVACVACHDAGKLQVGRVKDTGAWTTWRTTELLGRKTTAQYQSHNLQRQVDCARCHFPGNTFGLREDVKTQP